VDLHDVSWIDPEGSDEGGVRVKPIDAHLRKRVRPRRRGIDNEEFDSSFDVSILKRCVCRSDHASNRFPNLRPCPRETLFVCSLGPRRKGDHRMLEQLVVLLAGPQ
jgi:hypothetical protein